MLFLHLKCQVYSNSLVVMSVKPYLGSGFVEYICAVHEAQLLWKNLRLGSPPGDSGLKARQAFKGSTHHYPLEYNLEKIKKDRGWPQFH